ncbi:lipoprotein, partial [bacterium]|nr:lipoprotein [bacterium]
MRKTVYILAALLVLIVSGCGLTSGTAFVSQEVSGT